MSQIFERIKRKCQFSKKRAEKRIEKEVENKQITQFCNMDNQLALMNKEQIYVYNTENGHLNYVLRQKLFTRYSKIIVYHFRFIKLHNVHLLLFVCTDRIVVFQKNRLVFKQKINEPLYRYDNFYYDKYEHYFIIQGRTMADNFSLFVVSKLFSKQANVNCMTPNFLRLALDYNSIFYQTKTIFKQLSQNYLTIDSICMLPQHKLFLYNKQEKELYLCDLNKLYQTYPTFAFLGDYEHSIFKIDKTQNCLPFQHITGVYNKVYADKIEYHRNYLLLVQEKDPISEIVWKEQYCLEDEGTLSYMTKNGKRYRA
ncbi:unnamed protein product (macronuclear) [Paramecium tetraurelia]|uniref:Uncharacterized protein n=1 Tax=Paramecium tetraurelia TaxID=5888 RepID=A0CXH9_PARTE|nr:uncharacterized protein GSPATT00011128001 [Paramecium tetraurelia]CAK75496.1 unnamed protein product [Paramecium tetraurelia]|eukprot:XP_001442893.1 hypothetical protein (macronuclear) [Paramecium tetraurelia strain d4-2]